MAVNKLDPVSQSFTVEKPTYITKVDLFFATKDNNIPVFLQIRRINDGFPSQQIVSNSQKIIPATDVIESSDATTATTVSFNNPVFLDTGEYALSIGSDSKEYSIYVSELNATDSVSGRKISEQPLIGSLFLSENLSTFTPSLFKDIKCNIYRANFYTNVTANVNLTLDRGYVGASLTSSLDDDPLEAYPGTTTVKVYHFNHGFINDSYVILRNVANANVQGNIGNVVGVLGTTIQDVEFKVGNVKLDSYTIALENAPNVRVRTRFGGSYVKADENIGYSSITPQLSIFSPANTSVVNKVVTTTPATGTGSSYVIDTSLNNLQNGVEKIFDTAKVLASPTNRSYKSANTDSIRYNLTFNTNDNRVSPIIDTKQLGLNFKRNLVNNPSFGATVLSHELNLVSNIGDDNKGLGHKANIVVLNNNIGVISFTAATDKDNANAIINGTFLNVQANTSATDGSGFNNSGLYRVLDVIDGGANIKIAKITGNIETDEANNNVYHIVNSPDFIAEEAPTGGTSYSKYISRQVDFENASTGIKFLLDIAKPAESTVDFYYKTKLAGDNTNMNNIEYKKVANVSITNSLAGEFTQFSKIVDNIDDFNSIVFKIVMNSSNESRIPKIKNLRVISLQ